MSDTARRDLRARPRGLPNAVWTAAIALGLIVLFFVLQRMSAFKPLDHDEHQFIASGATWARYGWLPYVDAPYHHLPYLSFLYAAVFSVSDTLLGSARTVSVLGAVGIAALTGYASAQAFARRCHTTPAAPATRAAIATAAVVVLISNPIFVYTSGRAWNHDLAVLFTMSAALIHMRWLRSAGSGNSSSGASTAALVAGGALLGLGVGIRSSFALVIPAFAASFLVLGNAKLDERARAIGAFAVGGFLALVPVLYFLGIAPQQFAFGNFRYNTELNTEYRRITEWNVAMDLGGKLDYLATEVLSHRRNSLLLAAYIVSLASAWSAMRRSGVRKNRNGNVHNEVFVGLLLACLLGAAWSPTPTWYQYFFPLVPLLIVGCAHALARHEDLRSAALPTLVVVLLALTSLAGLRHYIPSLTGTAGMSRVAFTSSVGAEIRDITPPGRVATLGPIFALEAGREIYPWLATGPFSIRTAGLVEPELRRSFVIVAPDELFAALEQDPPVAVLTGIEQGDDAQLEAPLAEFARKRGMQPHTLTGGIIAWVAESP